MQAPGRLFRHIDQDIDLVRCAGYFLRLYIHFSEKTESVDPVTRQLDLVAVIPGGFELAEFPAQHFVAGSVVATNGDAAHVDAAHGLGLHREHDAVIDPVEFGLHLNARKGIAERAEIVGKRLGRFIDPFRVVRLAGAHRDQGFELFFLAQIISLQLDAGDGVFLAFGHIHGDHQIFTVR